MNSIKLYLISKIVHIFPETRAFKLKNRLYSWAGVKTGKNVHICSSAKIIGAGELVIGDNTWVGPDTLISASLSINIGAYCDIAPRVLICDGTHELTPQCNHKRVADIEVTYPITIGNGCWICSNASILAGVEIGNKCVVAAGAVVTNSYEDGVMLGGVPAKIIKELE